jgi:PKD repeat protein
MIISNQLKTKIQMKRLTLALLMALIGLTVLSQQVPREMVILEKGTGTWCTWCPSAAQGVEDLLNAGCNVACIAYHYNDAFQTPASLARINYYGITGYPTAKFDGVLTSVGGSTTGTTYGAYLPHYQTRIAIPCDFTIDVYGENSGLTYDIMLELEQVATSSASNIKAHLVVTENEIPYTWFTMTELNHVERLMVPDQNGTSVDFSGSSIVTVNLQFTLDPSWNANHIELVAFLQDNVTKECLQGVKVLLNDLQPFAATAGYECSDQTPCVTTAVQFTDQSGGNITTWNWTFEGGSPSSSTDPNPEVTYNALGEYDVQLIVSDGETTDTLLNQDYINVITVPAQPNTPTGNTILCEDGPQEVYETDPVPWGATYVWSVTPATAGTITGIDPVVTFTPNPGYLGPFDIKVRCDNSCGDGTWSQPLAAEIYPVPVDFTLSQGGGYCEGEPGIEVTLDGSETGVDYELYLDGDPTGNIVSGTGSAISFGYQTEQGIYTCHGFTSYCENEMIGNTYIFVVDSPETASTPTGSTQECNDNSGVEYSTEGAEHADTYVWSMVPVSAGTITGDSETAIVDWADDFTGTAYISVQGVNDCGSGDFSEELEVTVSQAPAPVVSGENVVCSGDVGILYSTPDNEGSSFVWEVEGGTVSSGAGTHEIAVSWGAAGMGAVRVTETTADNCEGLSEDFAVTIEDCTGLDENGNTAFRIYPNPVKDELVMEITSKEINATGMIILNQYGQVVYSRELTDAATMEKITVPTSNLTAGMYSIRVKTSDGTALEKKFVKVR